MPTKRVNLRGRRANVSIHRNGLSIELPDVPAADAGIAAAELLRVMRTLTKRFPELVVDAGTLGAGPGIEVDDEDGIEDGSDPISAKRVLGFSAR